jgi:hypothetical protein
MYVYDTPLFVDGGRWKQASFEGSNRARGIERASCGSLGTKEGREREREESSEAVSGRGGGFIYTTSTSDGGVEESRGQTPLQWMDAEISTTGYRCR